MDSVYINDSSIFEELDIERKNIVLKFNEANSRGLTSVADSLKKELLNINNKMDASKIFTGLKLYHVSQGKNELGEMVMNRGSFYLDSNFVVKEFIMTEDSLMRTNE